MRTDATPFVVGQIRRVSPALHEAERRPPSRPPSTYQTVSLKLSEKSRMPLQPSLTGHRDGLLGPFWCLYTGQSYSRNPAPTPFRTVSLGISVNKAASAPAYPSRVAR